MPVTVYERTLQVIATDFVKLYKACLPHAGNLTSDVFQRLCSDLNFERVHYAGSSTSVGFLPSHVRACLDVAASYLVIAPEQTQTFNHHCAVLTTTTAVASCESDSVPFAMEFGLTLLAFLFYTQPVVEMGKSPIRQLVDLTPSTLHFVVEAARLSPHLKDLTRHLLKDGAVHITPAVNGALAIRTLIVAHNLYAAPLLSGESKFVSEIQVDDDEDALLNSLLLDPLAPSEDRSDSSNAYQLLMCKVAAYRQSTRGVIR